MQHSWSWMIFGGNVKSIYKFHVQPINPRHPEMYLHHYMCGRSCFASLAPKHGSSVHVLAVGELFRNHGVELVLRHLRRNCQCLHLKQALTRTAIQSLHTLAAFGRRATNHVSCMTKLEIRRVLPRIIKDMCLLSIPRDAYRRGEELDAWYEGWRHWYGDIVLISPSFWGLPDFFLFLWSFQQGFCVSR